MITLEQYNIYHAEEDKLTLRNQYLCWHCRKIITDVGTFFRIEKLLPMKNRGRKYYTIHFHQTCFLKIAGNAYDMEMNYSL